MLDVPILRLDRDLPLPGYARPGDAGIDLMSRISTVIQPDGGRALVPTGVAVSLPEGRAGFVLPRSGLALKHGVTCLNTPGLIDSGYRGERIAQLVVMAVEQVRLVEVDSIEPSTRGDQGFGSTGR